MLRPCISIPRNVQGHSLIMQSLGSKKGLRFPPPNHKPQHDPFPLIPSVTHSPTRGYGPDKELSQLKEKHLPQFPSKLDQLSDPVHGTEIPTKRLHRHSGHRIGIPKACAAAENNVLAKHWWRFPLSRSLVNSWILTWLLWGQITFVQSLLVFFWLTGCFCNLQINVISQT